MRRLPSAPPRQTSAAVIASMVVRLRPPTAPPPPMAATRWWSPTPTRPATAPTPASPSRSIPRLPDRQSVVQGKRAPAAVTRSPTMHRSPSARPRQTSAAATAWMAVRLRAPTVALAHDTGTSSSDNITNDAALTVRAAAADVSRSYSVDGGPASATYSAPAADGSHTVVVTDTDTAGNSANASITFTLDTTIARSAERRAGKTGTSSSDQITNDASLTVSAAAADVSRSYSVDGGPASSTYSSAGPRYGHEQQRQHHQRCGAYRPRRRGRRQPQL